MTVDERFTVRVIHKGEHYGLNDCLTHDFNDPLVEFWDNEHNQFVSRYYKSTLLERGDYGLNLQGGVPEWWVSAEGMAQVKEFLANA